MYDFLPDIKRIYLSHIACQKIFYNNTPGFQINCWEKKIRLMKTSLRKLLFKFFNYWEERAKNRCKIRLWLRQHGEKKLSEYGDFFWSVFSPIWADYENLLYSVRKRENAYQTNIHMGHFSGSVSGQQTLWKKTLSSHLEKSMSEFFQYVIFSEELPSRCSREGCSQNFGWKHL